MRRWEGYIRCTGVSRVAIWGLTEYPICILTNSQLTGSGQEPVSSCPVPLNSNSTLEFSTRVLYNITFLESASLWAVPVHLHLNFHLLPARPGLTSCHVRGLRIQCPCVMYGLSPPPPPPPKENTEACRTGCLSTSFFLSGGLVYLNSHIIYRGHFQTYTA